MSMIHILDGQENDILGVITAKNILTNNHRKSLKDNLETFDFRTFADKDFSQHLGRHNRVIIPSEDKGFIEFVIWESSKYRDSEGLKAEVYASASYLLLKKAGVIKPQTYTEQTASMIAGRALNGTEWQVGIVEGKGIRTIAIEEHTKPYAFLRKIAKEFGLELNFRVETDGNRVIGRYVDLLEQVGQWRGREVEFGKDLIGIRRTEKTDNIYTALLGLGPVLEGGTRLEVSVEDEDALQRWGRPDKHGQLQHLVDVYEPESTRENMTREELTQYTRTELDKRINAVVEYNANIADLEHVPGMENKKIRFGDTIKIKDLEFNPPLYIEARVHTQDRDIIDKSNKHVELGDFIEYTEAEVKAIWQTMQEEIRKKLDKLVLVSIVSSAGNVFKNGIGSTELEVKTFLGGTEVDEDGSRYGYHWFKYDKDGELVTNFSESKKSIIITAASVDEKASYTVHIALGTEILTMAQVTISNVFDGDDGDDGKPGLPGSPGLPGKDGKTLYTWIKYATNSSGGGMSDTPGERKYMGIAYNKESPIKSINPSDYEWSKHGGDQGIPGVPGADGTPRYTWIKYADDDKGFGMSDSAKDKRFLGLAHNKTTANESVNPADYTWSPLYDNVIVGGRNLFTLKDATRNAIFAWATGNMHVGEVDSLASGFIQILPLEQIICNYFVTQIMFYDINKSFLGTYFNGSIRPPGSNGTSAKEFSIPNSDAIFYMRISFRNGFLNGSTIEDKRVMLEKGNIPTDWTPAPEDTDQAIEDVDNRVTTTEASVTALDKEVKLKAAQTDLNLVTGRVEHAETTLELLPGQFNAKVSKNGVIGEINASPELILIDFERMKVTGELEAKHIKSLAGLNVNDQFVVDAEGKLTLGNNRVMIDDKGMQITRPDGAIAMTDGIMNNEYNVNSYDPHYMTAGKDEYSSFPAFNTLVGSPSWYSAVKGELDGRGVAGFNLKYQDVRDALGALAFQQYEFIHSARYLVFSYWKIARAGKHSLHVVNGTSDKTADRIYFEALEANRSGIIDCVIDLGKPTYRKRNVTFKIGWTHGWGDRSDTIVFRMVRVIQTDVL